MPMEVWAVIVHFGEPGATERAIAALARSTHACTCVIVDHGGNWPYSDAPVLRPGRNAGFAAGANLGARHALANGATHIWFLNNDAEPEPQTLERMVETAGRSRPAAMIGSLEVDPRDPDSMGPWVSRAPMLPASLRRRVVAVNGRLGRVDFLSGFSLLVSRDAVARTGFFDESFFHYFEDVDYSIRASEAQVDLVLDCAAATYHHRATSLGAGSEAESYYFFRNRLLLARRYRRGPALLVWLTADPRHGVLPLFSRRRLLSHDWPWLRGAWRGTLDGLRGRTGPIR